MRTCIPGGRGSRSSSRQRTRARAPRRAAFDRLAGVGQYRLLDTCQGPTDKQTSFFGEKNSLFQQKFPYKNRAAGGRPAVVFSLARGALFLSPSCSALLCSALFPIPSSLPYTKAACSVCAAPTSSDQLCTTIMSIALVRSGAAACIFGPGGPSPSPVGAGGSSGGARRGAAHVHVSAAAAAASVPPPPSARSRRPRARTWGREEGTGGGRRNGMLLLPLLPSAPMGEGGGVWV